ncbi:FYVE zinc finger-domain-containing protein, partial [Vararia minispora EC-137]
MPSSPSSSSLSAPSVASSSDLTRSPASTTSLPSLSEGSSSSSSSIASLHSSFAVRPFEHLAVLLPRNLWKPDSHATRCDAFACRLRFSLLERRHHCRKCGGVFCHQCSARTTRLLDTSSLDFLNPPKGTPLAVYASPEAPLLSHRVCDGCYNQIHGIPRTPLPIPAI